MSRLSIKAREVLDRLEQYRKANTYPDGVPVDANKYRRTIKSLAKRGLLRVAGEGWCFTYCHITSRGIEALYGSRP